MKIIPLGLLFIFILVLIYGILVEPYSLDIEEQYSTLPELHSNMDICRIAVMGDLQVGMWMDNIRTIQKAVDWITQEKPDIVLLIGDFVYHPVKDPAREMDKVFDLLRPLSATGIPHYAVLGNHDYAMNGEEDQVSEHSARTVEQGLERLGVQVLNNEAVRIELPAGEGENRTPCEGLYIVGLGAEYPDMDRPAEALEDVPTSAPRLVLMHHPDSFAGLPASSAPLAVAGHTHGGQISLPFTPDWSWLTFVRADEVHADGWIEGYGAPGNRLYVNRGIGFSLLPIRINAPPEITVFYLQNP